MRLSQQIRDKREVNAKIRTDLSITERKRKGKESKGRVFT